MAARPQSLEPRGGGRLSPEDPLTTLERWREGGGDYQVLHLSEDAAVVDLCTCDGQPMERLESGDPRLIEYLRHETP